MKLNLLVCFVLLLSIGFAAAQENSTIADQVVESSTAQKAVEQPTTSAQQTSESSEVETSSSTEVDPTNPPDVEKTEESSDKPTTSATSVTESEQPTTQAKGEQQSTLNPCPSVSTEQQSSNETTTAATEQATSQETTTQEPSCDLGQEDDFCLNNDDCCGDLKCNLILCAPCVTKTHGCEDDTDCCKGLKCIQVSPFDNNKYSKDFFPAGQIFNPSKQCLPDKKKKKSKFFDWSGFVPKF